MRINLATVQPMSLATTTERIIVDVSYLDYVSVQAIQADTTAWTSATLLVKVSNNKNDWSVHPASAVTIAAGGGITNKIDVYAFRWICIEVGTTEASVRANIWVYGEGQSDSAGGGSGTIGPGGSVGGGGGSQSMSQSSDLVVGNMA
jgi:uncharacterized membrane protein YgcG